MVTSPEKIHSKIAWADEQYIPPPTQPLPWKSKKRIIPYCGSEKSTHFLHKASPFKTPHLLPTAITFMENRIFSWYLLVVFQWAEEEGTKERRIKIYQTRPWWHRRILIFQLQWAWKTCKYVSSALGDVKKSVSVSNRTTFKCCFHPLTPIIPSLRPWSSQRASSNSKSVVLLCETPLPFLLLLLLLLLLFLLLITLGRCVLHVHTMYTMPLLLGNRNGGFDPTGHKKIALVPYWYL